MFLLNRFREFIIHVILPLVLSALVYIGFRTNSIKMFDWFDYLGIGFIISAVKEALNPFTNILPSWVYFSLPDGLWLYSFISTIIIIWYKHHQLKYWVVAILLLGICSEIFQAIGWVRGTFDYNDLLMYLIFGVLPFLTLKLKYDFKT